MKVFVGWIQIKCKKEHVSTVDREVEFDVAANLSNDIKKIPNRKMKTEPD